MPLVGKNDVSQGPEAYESIVLKVSANSKSAHLIGSEDLLGSLGSNDFIFNVKRMFGVILVGNTKVF